MIVSVKYTNASNFAEMELENGTIVVVDTVLPPDETYRRLLHDWREAGGVIEAYVPPPMPTPTDIGKLHFIRALRHYDMKTLFDTIMSNASDEIQEDYSITTRIVRSDPMTVAFETIAKTQGVTTEQVDDVFVMAYNLEHTV